MLRNRVRTGTSDRTPLLRKDYKRKLITNRGKETNSSKSFRRPFDEDSHPASNLKRLIIRGFLLVTIVGATAWVLSVILTAFLRTSLFELQNFEILGTTQIDRREIFRLCGFEKGKSIFSFNLSDAQERILTKPLVKGVWFKRELPGKILVKIIERKPVGLVRLDNIYGVDDEGVLLPRYNQKMIPNLPVFVGQKINKWTVGKVLQSKEVLAGIAIIKSFKRSPPSFFNKISEVQVSEPVSIILFLNPGSTKVMLGEQPVWEQTRRLETVLGDLTKRSISAYSIDLRFGEQVVVQLGVG